ncbi:MAG: ATP-dependent RecD-like DNA helicase [Victivallaceae bacterium]|nr:ATP-dependent RecD-like DNA helicase [Victivallaceae bacterium]
MGDIQTLTAATLRGEIKRVVFDAPKDGYAILKLTDDRGREQMVRGSLSGLAPGQFLEMEGRWEKHAEFGRQFRAEKFRIGLPSSTDGIKRFLASGIIPGVGRKTAESVVEYFGADTIDVLDHYSKRLYEIPRLGRKKIAAIIAGWKNSSAMRESSIFLQGLGISPAYCARLFRSYGDKAVEVVQKNPYRLAEEVDGIGFLKADEIAKSVGIARDSVERMTAAAIFEVNTLIGYGHVCCRRDALSEAVQKLTAQSEALAAIGISSAIGRGLLVEENRMIYTPLLAKAENELPELIAALALPRRFSGLKMAGVTANATPDAPALNAAQRGAVEATAKYPLSIITGGPGVGKTTVVGEIVRRAKAAGLRLALAAPTGRAAKRLSESTGVTAKTLHRLLGYDPAQGCFAYDGATPLPCDMLIVDEVSMLDILMAQAVFRAVKPGSTVVLVGDADQLPSVGPGTVLNDLIKSGWFAVTRLTEIFRQAGGSRIIVNAHRVNRGETPERPEPGADLTDFYWVEQDDPEKALDLVQKLVCERIPARFGLNPAADIQVLSPMNRGSCGTIAINDRLQQALNGGPKPQFAIGERVYKCGDKVMQTANNYEKNVFNGDLGLIWRIKSGEKKFTVLFDGDRAVDYNMDEADQLVRAYAITVHKSQGSEFPAVVLPLLTQHYMMLQRNLLYTAMTRAKKLLVLVGSRKAVGLAVDNSRVEPRYSQLGVKLAALRRKFV